MYLQRLTFVMSKCAVQRLAVPCSSPIIISICCFPNADRACSTVKCRILNCRPGSQAMFMCRLNPSYSHLEKPRTEMRTGVSEILLVSNAVVTPLRKATSYEPRIAILGIWGDTWLTRGKYGIYVAVRCSYGALNGSTYMYVTFLPRKISPFYCRVSYVAVTRIPSLVLRNTWHYVIIRRRKF